MTNKLSEKKGGGLIYKPGMMTFDGSTGYYSKTGVTTSGNAVTCLARIKNLSPVSGDRWLIYTLRGSFSSVLFGITSSGDADNPNTVRFEVRNSANTVICRLFSNTVITDGGEYLIFAEYDGTAGTGNVYINGIDDEKSGATNRVLGTGTINTGITTSVGFGGTHTGTALVGANIGFAGMRYVSGLTPTDFCYSDGKPKALDESGWVEWGSQPLFWNPHGLMTDNRGSAGAMTENGTITPVFEDAEYPMIGLPTTATASIGVNGSVSGYAPGMMLYDGSTGYHGFSSYTAVGNKVTMVGRFKRAAFTTGNEAIARAKAGGSLYSRMYAFLEPSNHADSDQQSRMVFNVLNSSGTIICYLVSTSVLADDNVHTFLISFDGDTGAATFIVDGQDEDNVSATNRVAPTTGTLATTGCLFSVGSADDNTAVSVFGGEIGFFGHGEVYLTNWQDFMEADGRPKQLDESGWAEWGGQPRFWNPHGEMRDNRGSLGDMTKNGVVEVGDGGSTPTFPIAAALATSSDVLSGKTAWVDGVEVLGTDPGIKKGLVSWWQMNETMTGGVDTIYDSHGSVDLIENGSGSLVLTHTDGTFGQVLDFTGSGSSNIYITASDARQLPYNSNFCLAGWVNLDSIATGSNQVIVCRADNGASSNATIDWEFRLNNANTQFEVLGVVGSTLYTATWTPTISASTWYFVYVHHDAELDQMGISIDNGTLVTAGITGNINTGGDQFKFGRRSFNASWDAYTDGKMSRWGLWSRTLTTDERTWLFAGGPPGRSYADL